MDLVDTLVTMMFTKKVSQVNQNSTTTKRARTTTIPRKDRLFEDFCSNVVDTVWRLERLFELQGLEAGLFGSEVPTLHGGLSPVTKDALKQNRSWKLLSQLYDYAVEGIDAIDAPGSESDGTSSLVIDAGEVIALLSGEEAGPSDEWHDIIRMGDGRFALEDGQALDVARVALLANVDMRTVRNAISAGALVTTKHHEDVLIANESARAWLMSRKGFKPTSVAGGTRETIAEVQSVSEFAAFLRERRAGLPTPAPLLDAYPGLTAAVLAEAEAGVFRAPLGAVWPMADFYGVVREELLACVMRVFFPDELAALTGRLGGNAALKLAPRAGAL